MNALEATDWLDDILTPDAPLPADPAFVTQVLHRMAMQISVPPSRPIDVLLAWPWVEALMAVLVITTLVAFTPALTQGWVAFSRAPWDATVWSQGGFCATCLCMVALVYGALEVAQVRLADVTG
jgi:hypothetical protein